MQFIVLTIAATAWLLAALAPTRVDGASALSNLLAPLPSSSRLGAILRASARADSGLASDLLGSSIRPSSLGADELSVGAFGKGSHVVCLTGSGAKRGAAVDAYEATQLLLACDFIVLTIPYASLCTGTASDDIQLLQGLTESLLAMPTKPASKRRLLVVVTGFDGTDAERQESQAVLYKDMKALFDTPPPSARVKAGESPSFGDYFDSDVFFLPPAKLEQNAYATKVKQLSAKIDEALSSAGGPPSLSVLQQRLARPPPSAVPRRAAAMLSSDSEVLAAYETERIKERLYAKFVDDVSKQSRSFHRGFDSGFPSLCDNLIQAALNSYDAATKDYSPTAARLKNRQAFIKLMLNDLVEKYEAQLRALMGLTVDRFRQGLSKTRIGPGVVRALEGAQRDALAFFTSNAHRLKPRSAGNAWSEAAQRHDLQSILRDQASSVVELARAQGALAVGGARRKPIALSLHYLSPTAFGLSDFRRDITLGTGSGSELGFTKRRAGVMSTSADPRGDKDTQILVPNDVSPDISALSESMVYDGRVSAKGKR
ncbi:unnamed protein product [Vitrella brassicaformis CCMP3155]|uniref:Uncharacterized protein n=1 Tax=Vitrella brassicaformis (strain CCMP3155) TaxID=1169540 RepID=A0A0G4F966_VITBC|nr:unnamed protein product [Vitrella brassicaformis CCMP3155]|eukprot:CEM08910.1 unnamed protein product [Vitrella brassicaformis CCMP3155]